MNYGPPGSSVRGDSPGKRTGVGCHALLQGIFPTQGSNPHFLHLLHRAGGFFITRPTWEALYKGKWNLGLREEGTGEQNPCNLAVLKAVLKHLEIP